MEGEGNGLPFKEAEESKRGREWQDWRMGNNP